MLAIASGGVASDLRHSSPYQHENDADREPNNEFNHPEQTNSAPGDRAVPRLWSIRSKLLREPTCYFCLHRHPRARTLHCLLSPSDHPCWSSCTHASIEQHEWHQAPPDTRKRSDQRPIAVDREPSDKYGHQQQRQCRHRQRLHPVRRCHYRPSGGSRGCAGQIGLTESNTMAYVLEANPFDS
jgi:hypothetical protein